MTFDTRIDDRTARIAVVGLGYVGLPLAMAYADAGFSVIGVDVSEKRVAALQRGESPILDVPASKVQEHVRSGRFCATATYDAARDADAIFVCVPTPFDRAKAPDLSFIENAAARLAEILRAGQLVILESTTYPGTTEEVLVPILERSGLRAGADFHLAFSPERIDPGNRTFTIANTPKVVGGIDEESTRRAALVLEQVVRDGQVRRVSSPRVAELTKLLENTFRAVNIALVNEIAMLCDRMGIDVWEVIEAASTKPYGYMPFYPGPGVGGHCLATGETVVVRTSAGAGPRVVDEIWQDAARAAAPRALDGCEVIDAPDLEMLGVGIDGPARWERATQLFRRSFEGELVHIRTVDGRDVVVTHGHPMLVAGTDGVTARRATDIRPGDLLPVVTDLTEPPTDDPAIDLISAIRGDLVSKVRVRVRGGSWVPYRDLLQTRYGHARVHDWLRQGQIPLQVFLELGEANIELPPRERLTLWTGRGPARASIDAVVRLTPRVARVIGYYATEGCITADSSLRVRFTFHAAEDEIVADLCEGLRELGQRWSVSHDRSCENVHVKVSSPLFAVLLRDALDCGVSSYDAAVPEVLLAASRSHRLALLAGLLRGDGSVDTRTGMRAYRVRGQTAASQNNSASIGFWTTSVRLERQFSFLTQSLGLRTSIQRRRTQTGADFHLLGAESQPLLATLLADRKPARLRECLASKRRTPRSRGIWSMAGQAVTSVASVERRRAKTRVYSIETADTHTFATGYGIFVHNCIPVDPYYLAWKARQYDFHTKFVELAAETNLAMPFFTASRVRALLNRHGKPLHGARLLVLGASFKPDIDDARNSAAIRVIEILRDEGASVEYHDPYVPQVHISTALYRSDGHVDLGSVPLTAERIAAADCVVILVGHSSVDYRLVADRAARVFDAVNAMKEVSGNALIERL